jgi:hypothetical protein
MTALESEIRSIESGGGNASAKRAQLASIYDQLDPKRRNQASPQQSPPQQRPPVLLGGVPQPSIDINAIPTRAEELRSPDGSIDTSKIPVVPASKFNTSTTLMGALDQMFKGSPTDSLDDLSFKIEGKAKARSDIAPMLNSPNEAVSTILGLMKQYGAMELPSQTLSPEEQSYIEQSFQVGPGRKFATIDDIPDQYVNFALGYGLVGLMSGGGLRGFTDAIGAGTANVQQQFDQQYAADQAQFESSRAINAAMAKRQAEISNENFKQRGYYAKDMRDLVEKVTSNVQTLDRQMQIGVLTSLTDFFKTGDSDRWNQYVETMGPTLQKMRITLPKMMPKTSKEAQIDATIASMGLKDQRLNQVMQFAKDLHPYEMEKLMTEVSILDGKDQQAGVRLEMMQKELAWMDKTKRAQVMLMAARAEAIKTQAKARLIEAQKPNSGASAGNIAALKAAAQIDSSQITQLVKGKKINLDQIKLLEKAIEENTLKAKSKAFSSDESQKQINESTGQKVNQISDLKAKNNDIDKTIDSLAKSQEELAKKLRGEK